MMKKISTLLLVAAITAGVGYPDFRTFFGVVA